MEGPAQCGCGHFAVFLCVCSQQKQFVVHVLGTLNSHLAHHEIRSLRRGTFKNLDSKTPAVQIFVHDDRNFDG